MFVVDEEGVVAGGFGEVGDGWVRDEFDAEGLVGEVLVWWRGFVLCVEWVHVGLSCSALTYCTYSIFSDEVEEVVSFDHLWVSCHYGEEVEDVVRDMLFSM